MKKRKSFFMNFFNKKGVTLAELCVVMALLGILSTTITSFCMIIKNYSDKMAIERSTRESYAIFNTAINTWIDYVDAEGYVITVKSDEDGLSRLHAEPPQDSGKSACDFYLSEEKIYATLPSGNQMELEMKTFQSMSFSFRTSNSQKKGGLIEYTITHLKNSRGATDKIVAVKAVRAAKVGD